MHHSDNHRLLTAKAISIEDYNYPLPEERIAKYPLKERDQCKLLVPNTTNGGYLHTTFRQLPALLPQGALLVMNDTKVIRARLQFFRPSGGRIEVFCLEPHSPALYEQSLSSRTPVTWHCLIGNARKWREPYLEQRLPTGHTLRVERVEGEAGVVRFSWEGQATFGEVLEATGELPIPPYLKRETEESDLETYQTVYAQEEGSVAAPTAGLHFTPQLFGELQKRGIELGKLTLHVGAGTFLPVKTTTMEGHTMHREKVVVNAIFLQQLLRKVKEKRPIVAVGTTSTRTLESLYYMGHQLIDGCKHPFKVEQWLPYSLHPKYTLEEALQALINTTEEQLVGETELLIAPGYTFRVVEQLITNFHQPRSTLLLLVAAFVGDAEWRAIYQEALGHEYRFLSYGDAMLLQRKR